MNTRHTNVFPDYAVNTSSVQVYHAFPEFLWSSNGRRSKSPVKWTNSHVQRQLVGHSIDSDNERVMRSRLNDTNISEALIIVFSLWEQAGHSERNAVERNLIM